MANEPCHIVQLTRPNITTAISLVHPQDPLDALGHLRHVETHNHLDRTARTHGPSRTAPRSTRAPGIRSTPPGLQ